MGSVGSPNSWAANYGRDCSQGICSFYCPQWCYYLLPPPPPLDGDSGPNLSPLIIAVIGILASAFLLVTYYTVISKYCKIRGRADQPLPSLQSEPAALDRRQAAQAGLDDALINSITVCRYQRGEGLIEDTECAVCLSEFQEEESLRLLPKCSHAFHLPCIDTWLKSHPNCPLCRAPVAPAALSPPPNAPVSQNSSTLITSSLQIQRGNDLVLLVDDRIRREEVAITLVCQDAPKNVANAAGEGNSESGQNFRRSVSMHSSEHISVADVLRCPDEEERLPNAARGFREEGSVNREDDVHRA